MPTTYAPACKCIYCGSLTYWPSDQSGVDHGRKLGEEHIIPASLHGDVVLKKASCNACERITSQIEQKCINSFFYSVRHALRLFREKGRKRDFATIIRDEDGASVRNRIPVNEVPGIMIMPLFRLPMKYYFDEFKPNSDEYSITAIFLPGFDQNLSKLGEEGLIVNGVNGFNDVDFRRMIAKIAHAFTCAVYGVDKFTHVLTPGILRADPVCLNENIGCHYLSSRPTAVPGHEIKIKTAVIKGRSHHVTSIKLFTQTDSPQYIAISGVI